MDNTGIYKAIIGVMKDIGAIKKNDENKFDGYKFRGIDAVYNAIQPAFVKNGVFIVPNLLSVEQEDRTTAKGGIQIHTKVTVEYTLYAEDGSSIKGIFPGEAMDRSDKSINKAMTAAYKYMLFELFTIPTQDNQDADAESPDAGTKGAPVDWRADVLKKCEESGIPIEFITSSYKVESIDAMTDAQLMVTSKMWAKVANSYKKQMESAGDES